MENTTVEIKRYAKDFVWTSNRISDVITENTEAISDCTAISFFNVGDVPVTILDLVVSPGDTLSFDGEKEVMDKTRYRITFESPTTGTNPKIIIHRTYVSKQDA